MDHKDLDAWKQAMNLVEGVYQLTRSFPKEEVYGLTAQVRRSAISIPSNLAEGSARRSTKEFANFLAIALGSLAELETQLLIAERLKYVSAEDTLKQSVRVRALLLGLRKSQMSRR
jgi:four helix bundle protein